LTPLRESKRGSRSCVARPSQRSIPRPLRAFTVRVDPRRGSRARRRRHGRLLKPGGSTQAIVRSDSSPAAAASIRRAVASWTAPKLGVDSLFLDLSSIGRPTEELSRAFADPTWSAAVVESLRQTSPDRRFAAQSAIPGSVALDAAIRLSPGLPASHGGRARDGLPGPLRLSDWSGTRSLDASSPRRKSARAGGSRGVGAGGSADPRRECRP
jgi:hypothetical protein